MLMLVLTSGVLILGLGIRRNFCIWFAQTSYKIMSLNLTLTLSIITQDKDQ